MGGYAYAFSDMVGSSVCLNGSAFCGQGSTGAMSATVWGGGIGVNLNQLPGTMTPGVYAVPTAKAGISYTISSLPPGTVYLIIDNSSTAYYATLTNVSAMVPWASFKTTPWQADAAAPLGSAPTAATHIQFQLSAAAAASQFNFCVTALSFY